MIILCETCNRDVQAGDYDSHECQRSGVLEEQMACKVIRRILSESTSDNILQITTGGTVRYKNEVGTISHLIQPLTLVRVTKARLSQSEQNCSTKTLKQRVSEVQAVRSLLSPEIPEQVLVEEIKALGREEKMKVLVDAGITLDIETCHESCTMYALEPTSEIKKVILYLCENKIKPTFLCSDGCHIRVYR